MEERRVTLACYVGCTRYIKSNDMSFLSMRSSGFTSLMHRELTAGYVVALPS